MANYSDIKGYTVQTVSSDPAASVAATGSWASGGTMNTARSDLAGLGIETSAMAVAGYSGSTSSAVENYDGTSWTEIAELNSSKNSLAGFGATNTASIACGGRSPTTNKTEYWNGSSWTEVNEMNTARFAMNISGAGTATSGLVSGGNGAQDTVEVWDGTNWTAAGAELNQTRSQGSAAGQSSSSAVAVGGSGPGNLANTEQWNGSSWTEVADLNSARYSAGASGDVNTILINGGELSPQTTKTESFDGTSWTEVADLSTARKDHGSTGYSSSNSSGLSFAGKAPPTSFKDSSELWTTTPSALFQKTAEGQLFFNSTANVFKETVKDIPGATWSSGGNLNTGRRWGGQGVLGIQTATLLCGGSTPPGAQANTEQYNGTSWTEVNDLNAANNASMCWGTTTSAINCGGVPPRKQVESWDGTSWTETTDFNNPRYGGLGAGSSNTSGIIFGGENPSPGGPHPGPYFSATEVWDGSSWTEVNEMNQARYGMLGGGAIYTAAIGAGGADPVPSYAALTEIWDGTSWTEVSDMNEKRMTGVGFGITTSLIATGSDPQGDPPRASTELWDGTSWSQLTATISTDNKSQMSSGGANASTGVIFGGRTPPANVQTSTEEWTAGLSNKTITSS